MISLTCPACTDRVWLFTLVWCLSCHLPWRAEDFMRMKENRVKEDNPGLGLLYEAADTSHVGVSSIRD